MPIPGQRWPLARVVDEEFLAGAVGLPHRDVDPPAVSGVPLAELAVAIGSTPAKIVDVRVAVLDPQQLQRHAVASEFAMHPLEVDRHTLERKVAAGRGKELGLELDIAELTRDLPRDPSLARTIEIAAHRPLRESGRRRDRTVPELQAVSQSQYFEDFSHVGALHLRRR